MGEGTDEAETDESEEPAAPSRKIPSMSGRRDLEMDVIGWIIFIGMVILLIPLIPFVVLLVIVSKLLGLGRERGLSWQGRLNGA